MNKIEQKRFIREMSKAISDDLCKRVSEGKIPPEWDGHELRTLLAHRHKQSASMTVVERASGWDKRRRSFWNHVNVSNL